MFYFLAAIINKYGDLFISNIYSYGYHIINIHNYEHFQAPNNYQDLSIGNVY